MKEDDIAEPFCIILNHMSECIKHFENGGKNMFFSVKYGSVLVKYNEI